MRRILTALIVVLAGLGLRAQSDTVVSLLTAYPGADIYELEGHSAIRLNMGPGQDYAVSYGIFNFNAPNFVYRFVKGETDYMVGLVPMDYFLESYARQGRRVEELPLSLTPAEKRRLVGLLTENLLPENRVYRYNYVKDNCATRPLKMIEMSLADTLHLGTISLDFLPEQSTFRDVMRHYHANYPWYQFGIDLALGSGIDYPLSSREYTFVPMLMAEQLAASRVGERAISGIPVALIDLAPDAAVEGPTPWVLSPLFVCWVVFCLLLAATVNDNICCRVTRWIDAVYFGVLGFAGLLLTFLIFISVHEATSPNYLYLWLNPLCLIPTIFIWIRSCRKIVLIYQAANFGVLIVALIAWPWLPQSANPAFLPLVLATVMRSGSYVYINVCGKRR